MSMAMAVERERLRALILRSLRQQGFQLRSGQLIPPDLRNKDLIRRLHEEAVRHRIARARAGLEPHEGRLLSFIARGSEVAPERVRPRLVVLRTDSEDELLFRYACLHWSIPVSSGYGRRIRFLVYDESNGKLIGLFGIGDPVFSLGPRDRWIGWGSAQKKARLQCVMDLFVLGAVPPYSQLLFGKTGSGKSVLAKMILLAYARYPKMALLVIDPQGEFSRDMKPGGTSGEFALPVGDVLRTQGKRPFVMTVRQLVLDRWDLFRQILAESRFFRELQIMTQDKVDLACDQLTEAMRKASGIKLASLHERAVFDKAWHLLKQEKLQNKIYAREGTAAERFKDAVDEANPDDLYQHIWLPVANLFKEDYHGGRRKVEDALKWLLDTAKTSRPVLVIDVSKEQAQSLLWNDRIQALVIKRLLEGVTLTAEELYKEGESLNALVVIDEAHRLAPRELPSEEDAARGVRNVLIDAARTTRKYGLGWLFISQTLSSLHPEILQQLRIFFFGFGLGLGQEFQSLRQLVGSSGTALDLYQLFRDPHSAFDTMSRQYSFMTIGPVSPLSFSGTPLFLNAFSTVEAFLRANGLKTT